MGLILLTQAMFFPVTEDLSLLATYFTFMMEQEKISHSCFYLLQIYSFGAFFSPQSKENGS